MSIAQLCENVNILLIIIPHAAVPFAELPAMKDKGMHSAALKNKKA